MEPKWKIATCHFLFSCEGYIDFVYILLFHTQYLIAMLSVATHRRSSILMKGASPTQNPLSFAFCHKPSHSPTEKLLHSVFRLFGIFLSALILPHMLAVAPK